MRIQVTFFHNSNIYRPLSVLVEVESMDYYDSHKGEVQKRALMNIAHYRHCTPKELLDQGFTKVKVREYNAEKIKEQEERRHKVNLIKHYLRKRGQ